MAGFVHETADVHPEAIVGEDCRLWQHCVIAKGARLGRECRLGHNVFVEGGVSVGSGTVIKDNVCLYTGVEVDEDVFIGPNAVFTNVTNPRAFVDRKAEFRRTHIKRGATIGANATIVCGATIGAYAFLGAGTVVIGDVPDHALVVGNPSRQIGWVSREGHKLGDDLICPVSGEAYRETGEGLVAIDGAA